LNVAGRHQIIILKLENSLTACTKVFSSDAVRFDWYVGLCSG